MSIVLKGGYRTEDARLDRLPQFDPRSWDYPIRTAIDTTQPRSYTWPLKAFLDQGREGACVGFSIAHEIAAIPAVSDVNDALARQIYRDAQLIDEWPGEAYEGTSILAGIKVATQMGYFAEYRWAFGLDDLALAVGRKGPAVVGVNWYEGMYAPDAKGYIHPTGRLLGGHAILCRGVNVRGRYFTLHNSWGRDWGRDSTCRITWDDMERLLHEQGEACIPVRRNRK